MVWEICLALRGITNYYYCVSDETRYNRYTTGQDEALAGRRVNVYVQTTGTQAAVATQTWARERQRFGKPSCTTGSHAPQLFNDSVTVRYN